MLLSHAMADYLDHLRHELGHTPTTCASYQSWQRTFARWLSENGLPDPPRARDQRHPHPVLLLLTLPLRPPNIRGALHARRALFASLTPAGAIIDNPALEVRRPRTTPLPGWRLQMRT